MGKNEAIPEESKLPTLSEILGAPEADLRAARYETIRRIGRRSKEFLINVEREAMRVRVQEILEITDDESHIITLYRRGEIAELIQYLLKKAGLK